MKLKAGLLIGIVAAGAMLLTACSGDSATTVVSSTGAEGINVNGQGIAYGAPDVADVEIGVQAQAPTVAEARQQAATSMDAVVASIKGNGIADADLRTVQFSVDPRYGVSRPDGTPPQITGYQVSNVVTVRVRKLDTVAKIVDNASAAGGNNTVIRSLRYSILDQTKLQTEARELAIKEARDRADKLASLNGVKVGKPLQINENTQPIQPLNYGGIAPAVAAPRTGETSSTIESGQLRVVVNVNINYQINN